MFREGDAVTVRHEKPWLAGKRIQMRGQVASFDGELLVVSRRFQRPGQPYDGLSQTQRAGDHGTIELIEEGWVSRRRYLRAGGELIGELYNIQTPTVFRGKEASYLDLEIDVAYLPPGEEKVMIQDSDELRAAVARGFIPWEVAQIARALAEELAARLSGGDEVSRSTWDLRPAAGEVSASVVDWIRRTRSA